MEATLLTLGVILILVGLIGQVKAKEIEVGSQNPLVRVILGLIGVAFVAIALSTRIPTIMAALTNTPTLTPTSLPPVSETPTLTLTPTMTTSPTETPTTPPPTTAVPTTAVPTTAVPTTAVPTTAVPTTAVPTTPPPPPLSFAEDCLPFDTNNVRLRESGGNWWVVERSAMLYFGPNESEAREALDIILHYRMNNHCFVGRPDASLEYWLVNNDSPTGSYSGEDCGGFNLSNIEVVNISGRWKIVDDSSWLLDFADMEDEARKSYEILQHYRFNYICYVGRPDASMIYFRR